jgi:hypothetical protein
MTGDYLHWRDLADGRRGWVIPLTYGRARILVGRVGDGACDDSW